MRAKFLFAAISFLSTLASGMAMAVELQYATNQELMDELAFRLRVGGGGNGGNVTSVSYLCDSNSYLRISIVAPSGSESSKQYYTGDASFCSQQRAVLLATRSRLQRTAIIAVCDSSSYLQRFSVTTDGVVHDLNSTYIGDRTACFEQAKTINQP